MTPTEARAQVGKLMAHPVTFLLVVNVVCGILGLFQFAWAVSVLQPRDFAVIGVLAAIGGVIAGLLDVKLGDLTTRLFYAANKEDRDGRAAILASSLLLHVLAGVIVGCAMLAVSHILAWRFLEQPVITAWIAAAAARLATIYPISALHTHTRLIGEFWALGCLRLVTQIIITGITVAALVIQPDVTGYFAAMAINALVAIALATIVAANRVRLNLGTSLLRWPTADSFAAFRASGSFLAGGSLAGLSKLLSRSCDTLLLAALTNDATTGIYRVARQAFDTIAGLSDALHQFYTPTIVDCVNRNRWAEFRKHRFRLMLIGVTCSLGAIAGSWLILRPIAAAHYPHYTQALPAFEIFAGLLVITIGIHGWLWPTLVAGNKVGRFGLLGLCGAVLQLAAMIVLARAGWLGPAEAAATAWIMAAINYGPLVAGWLARQTARKPAA